MAADRPSAVEVSVVIPVLDGASTIGAQLDALLAQDHAGGFEIIVADNGSRDGTRAVVHRYLNREHEVRIADASRRRSANVARNVGVQAARGEKILFCDADDIVAPGWVAAMARALERADVVGGWVDYRPLNPHLEHRGPQSAVFRENGICVPLAACCGWRRSFLLNLGGYDESWIVGGDDIECALRAARAGARVAEATDAILYKRELSSRRALARRYYKYGRVRPRLIKTFPDLAERRSTWAALRAWGHLLSRLARGHTDHATVRAIAKNLGRLVGCLEHRCWAP